MAASLEERAANLGFDIEFKTQRQKDMKYEINEFEQELLDRVGVIEKKLDGTSIDREKGHISKLYEQLKPVVWILLICGTDPDSVSDSDSEPDRNMEVWRTGFTVDNELDLIITSAHFWCDWTNLWVKARRLGDDGFTLFTKKDVKSIVWDESCDFALFKIPGGLGQHCPVATLAKDGSLDAGETIFHIGHQSNFFSSCLIGSAAYPCTENVQIPTGRQTHVTPRDRDAEYRVFGENDLDIHPGTPIIQCNGLILLDGSEGGPVFNLRGEVVGLITTELRSFGAAIHVTMIRRFLQIQVRKLKGQQKQKRKKNNKGKKKNKKHRIGGNVSSN